MIHYVYVILALYGYFNFAIGSSNYNTFCENPHEYNGHAVVHHQNTFSMSCDDVLGIYSLSNISLADCHDLSISLWSEVFGSSNTSINVYDPPYFDQWNNISVGAVTRTGGCCRDGKPLCRNPSANTFCKNPDKYIGDAGVFGSGTTKNFTCNQAMHFIGFKNSSYSCDDSLMSIFGGYFGGPSEYDYPVDSEGNTMRGGCCEDNLPACDGGISGTNITGFENFCHNPADYQPHRIVMTDKESGAEFTCSHILASTGDHGPDMCKYNYPLFLPEGMEATDSSTSVVFHGGCCGNGTSICQDNTNICKNPDKFKPNNIAIDLNYDGSIVDSHGTPYNVKVTCGIAPLLFGYNNISSCSNLDLYYQLSLLASAVPLVSAADGISGPMGGCCEDGISVCASENSRNPNISAYSIPMCKNPEKYNPNGFGFIDDSDAEPMTCSAIKDFIASMLPWPQDMEPTQENFCEHMYGSFAYMELKRISSDKRTYANYTAFLHAAGGGCCEDGIFFCDEPKEKYEGICWNGDSAYDGRKQGYYAYSKLLDGSDSDFHWNLDTDDYGGTNNRRLHEHAYHKMPKLSAKYKKKMSLAMTFELDRKENAALVDAYSKSYGWGRLIEILQRRELSMTKLAYLAMKNPQPIDKSKLKLDMVFQNGQSGRKLSHDNNTDDNNANYENHLFRTAPSLSCNEIIKFVYNEFLNHTMTPIYGSDDYRFCDSDHEYLSFMEAIAGPPQIIYNDTTFYANTRPYWPDLSTGAASSSDNPNPMLVQSPSDHLKHHPSPGYDNSNQSALNQLYYMGGCCQDGLSRCRPYSQNLYNPNYNTICKNPNNYLGSNHSFHIAASSRFDVSVPKGWLTCNEAMYYIYHNLVDFNDYQWCRKSMLDDESKFWLLHLSNNKTSTVPVGPGLDLDIGGCCSDGLINPTCDFTFDDLNYPPSPPSEMDDDDGDKDNDDIGGGHRANRPPLIDHTRSLNYSSIMNHFFTESPYQFGKNEVNTYKCKTIRDKLDIISTVEDVYVNRHPLQGNDSAPFMALKIHFNPDNVDIMNDVVKSKKSGHEYNMHDAIIKIKIRRKSSPNKIKSKGFMLQEHYYYDSDSDDHVYLSPPLPPASHSETATNFLDDVSMIRMDLKVVDKYTGKYRSVACVKFQFQVPYN